MKPIKIYADFNGVFGDFLCLSHSETSRGEFENPVELREGLEVIAFDKDTDENGNPDDLMAKGIVERSPDWLQCNSSKWCLRIDENRIYHESEMQ